MVDRLQQLEECRLLLSNNPMRFTHDIGRLVMAGDALKRRQNFRRQIRVVLGSVLIFLLGLTGGFLLAHM